MEQTCFVEAAGREGTEGKSCVANDFSFACYWYGPLGLALVSGVWSYAGPERLVWSSGFRIEDAWTFLLDLGEASDGQSASVLGRGALWPANCGAALVRVLLDEFMLNLNGWYGLVVFALTMLELLRGLILDFGSCRQRRNQRTWDSHVPHASWFAISWTSTANMVRCAALNFWRILPLGLVGFGWSFWWIKQGALRGRGAGREGSAGLGLAKNCLVHASWLGGTQRLIWSVVLGSCWIWGDVRGVE